MIPYARQYISKKDKDSVLKVLGNDFLTTGPVVKNFEKKLREKFNCKYAVALSSATAGLHISCLALGLKRNQYLWTSPISFVSSSNCGLFCGANVDFIDIDKDDFNISIQKLENKLIKSSKVKKLPKVLVVVHLSGNPAKLDKISKLSKKYKFKVIEDASHASGSIYKKSLIGSCKFSDVTVFSFHPVKIFTTGEGGAILTNSKKIYEKSIMLRNQGILRKKEISIKTEKVFKPWFYSISDLGYNYRITDIQSALGISQLNKINKFIEKRNQIANFYKKKLSKKIKFQTTENDCLSSYHLFIIRVPSLLRNKIVKKLYENNIVSNLHYIPIYRHKLYKKFNFKNKNFNESEKYYKEAISLPMYYNLNYKKLKKIISIINSFYK